MNKKMKIKLKKY